MRATSKHLQIQGRSAKHIFILQMPRNIVSLFKRFGRRVFQIRTSSSCKPLYAKSADIQYVKTMNELKEIALKIYSVEKTKSPQDMVDNFELHEDLIESAAHNSSTDNHTLYIQLTSDYAIALTSISSYKKAVPYLNKGLSLLLCDTTIDKENIQKVKFYPALIFNRGICNYYLKNYPDSKKDFVLLTQLYPDNIIYKNWLAAIDTLFLSRIKNILWLVVAGLLLTELLLKHYNLPYEVILWTGILCLLVVIVLEIIIYDRKR